jgi:hypothetical protein
MTREEAHAQAEREVTEYARRGHLERISESDKPLLERESPALWRQAPGGSVTWPEAVVWCVALPCCTFLIWRIGAWLKTWELFP